MWINTVKNLIFISLIGLQSLSLYGSNFTKICELVRSNDSIKLEARLKDTKIVMQINENGRTFFLCI